MIKIHLLAALIFSASLVTTSLVNAQAGSQNGLRASTDLSVTQQGNSAVPNSGLSYPAGLIAVPEDMKHLIWVELDNGRLNLLERLGEKSYQILKSIPISIGKEGYGKEVEGDKRTPVGLYRVTSYIPEEELTDFYGLGAYPINYPNSWDKLQNRTGYGIWLHGLPKGVDQRPLLDSDGCVVVDNSSLTYLDDYVAPGNTLVVLANEMEWVNEQASGQADPVIDAIQHWQRSWESLDSDAYLDNYHTDFSDFKLDLDGWKEYKTRINNRKSRIDVEISDLSVFHYPGAEDLVSARFYQDYKSSNYNWSGWKELLWRKDELGQWKIVFEGNG